MFLFLVLCFSIVILNFLEFLVVMKLNCSILIWIFKILLLLLLLFLLFFRRNTILPSVQFLCFASLTSSFLIFVCLSFFHFSLNGFVESLILDVYNIFKCQALNSSWFFSLFLRPQQNYDSIWNFGCSQRNIHGCRRIEMGTYTLFFLADFAILQLPQCLLLYCQLGIYDMFSSIALQGC